MPQSLEMFHFNPVKFGLIVRQMAKEKRISQATMAARTGMSYDTVGNIYTGKIQKFPFEYVFKMCVVMEVSIEVLMLLMLKDEDVNFSERVLLYDTQKDEVVPVPDVLPSMIPGVVTDAVADTAMEAAGAQRDTAATLSGYYTEEEVTERIDRATGHLTSEIDHLREIIKTNDERHERYVRDITEQHRAHISDLKEQQQHERATGEKHREWILSVIASSFGKVNSKG
jgi:DNA-binding Xre family transcriptional regulator